MGNSILFNTAGQIALAVNYETQGPYSDKFLTKEADTTVRINEEFFVRVGNAVLIIDTDTDLDESDLDAGAAFDASDTYYIYACQPLDGTKTPVFKISKNATYPAGGWDGDDSRKIGGFDTDGSAHIDENSLWDLRTVDVTCTGIADANVASDAAISPSKLNLAQVVQRGDDTFNSTTGRSIAITAVADTDYHVAIEQRAESGRVGEISISGKTINAFTVKNSGSDVSTAFGWILNRI
jgi:hypothetical protein